MLHTKAERKEVDAVITSATSSRRPKPKISAALKPYLKQGETVKLSAKVDPSLWAAHGADRTFRLYLVAATRSASRARGRQLRAPSFFRMAAARRPRFHARRAAVAYKGR